MMMIVTLGTRNTLAAGNVAGHSRVMKSFPDIILNISGPEIKRTYSIRNLGDEFDERMCYLLPEEHCQN